jgi:flagellar biosynthesis protein FliQ
MNSDHFQQLLFRRTLMQALVWLVGAAGVHLVRFELEDWGGFFGALLWAPMFIIAMLTGLWIAFQMALAAIENRRMLRLSAIGVIVIMAATFWYGSEVAARLRLHRFQSRYDQIITAASDHGPDSAERVADSMGITLTTDFTRNERTLVLGFPWGGLLDNWSGLVWEEQSAKSGAAISKTAARARFAGFGELVNFTPLGSGWYFCSFT